MFTNSLILSGSLFLATFSTLLNQKKKSLHASLFLLYFIYVLLASCCILVPAETLFIRLYTVCCILSTLRCVTLLFFKGETKIVMIEMNKEMLHYLTSPSFCSGNCETLCIMFIQCLCGQLKASILNKFCFPESNMAYKHGHPELHFPKHLSLSHYLTISSYLYDVLIFWHLKMLLLWFVYCLTFTRLLFIFAS